MAAKPEINGTLGREATAETRFGHYDAWNLRRCRYLPTAMDVQGGIRVGVNSLDKLIDSKITDYH